MITTQDFNLKMEITQILRNATRLRLEPGYRPSQSFYMRAHRLWKGNQGANYGGFFAPYFHIIGVIHEIQLIGYIYGMIIKASEEIISCEVKPPMYFLNGQFDFDVSSQRDDGCSF